ncbi:TetR/AcrR family transcriptional regulator [Yinghuangia sp. YIM S10712]|uniref:TetR/AcrR family transcriptional regulator n=1 Tax=Yinghuangia sp. YIM S10712 TaxID=3436930 RepID=UPI003F535A67
MAAPRRVGTETSKTRSVLLDCAEQIMLDEGYAAVTYRNVASKAGVGPSLVQYYFPASDDLFVALVQDRTQRSLRKLAEDLKTKHPLRAIWDYANHQASAVLTTELMALGNHRERIRTEIAEAGLKARELALAALAEASGDYGFLPEAPSPDVLVFLMTSTPRMIVMEEAAGIVKSHAETIDYIERYLDQVDTL